MSCDEELCSVASILNERFPQQSLGKAGVQESPFQGRHDHGAEGTMHHLIAIGSR
jgi:hypothetical protein